MKALAWILAGLAIGVGVALLLRRDEPESQVETESVAENEAGEPMARKTYGWSKKTLVGL